MEGFEKEARGGQARREPDALQVTDKNFASRLVPDEEALMKFGVGLWGM
jgi:hypothetical protein